MEFVTCMVFRSELLTKRHANKILASQTKFRNDHGNRLFLNDSFIRMRSVALTF